MRERAPGQCATLADRARTSGSFAQAGSQPAQEIPRLRNTPSAFALRRECAVLALAWTASCSPEPVQVDAAPATVAVSVVEVQPRVVPYRPEFIGQTEAYQRVEIRSRIAGFLVRQAYVDGDKVTEGQLLFEIDPKPFEAQLAVAKAMLEQADARERNSVTELARQKLLLDSNASSQQEYDRAETANLTAVAEVALQKANLVVAELNLSYTKISSPVNGRAGQRLIDVGSFVGAGNSLLANCEQTDPISAYFSVSEREVLRHREQIASGELVAPADGQVDIQLVLIDGSVYPHEGRIDFKDIRVDPLTGTARLRAQFANPDETLVPGMFVKCRILGIEEPKALVVPQRCVMQSPAGAFVYAIGDGDVAEVRQLELGPWVGEDWLIRKGLEPGDRVIDDNLMKVQPGSKVTVTAAAPKPAASPPAGSGKAVKAPAQPAPGEKQ